MRWAPLLAVLVFTVLGGAWLLHESGRGNGTAGSSLARGERGLSVARAYLAADDGRTVGTLDRPLSAATAPAGATVFRLHPADQPDAHEGKSAPDPLAPAERAWVAAGGRLVVGFAGTWRGLRTSGSGRPHLALPLLPGVRVLGDGCRGLQGGLVDQATPAFVVDERPAISRLRLGDGEVWLLGCPEALENAGLGQADHLALLAALAGPGRPVLFDERSNGAAGAGGVGEVLVGWGLGGSLALAVLVLLALAWRRAVVPGPDSPPADPPAGSALDGVPAVAALYERAMTPAACLDLHHRRLQRAAAARHGGSAAGQAAMQRLLPNWRPPASADHNAFRAALRRLNHAFRSLRDEHPHRRP